jgi:hypothetical protein
MIAGTMIVLAAAAALWVLAPLFAARAPRDTAAGPAPPDQERERLLRDRDAAARALRDLELDRATGKLSDADYADLSAQYRAQARAVLDRLEALPAAPVRHPAQERDRG